LKAAILIASAAIAIASAASAAASTKCKLVLLAEWKLRTGEWQPVIDGAINGQPIGILLDTGAAVSIVTRSATRRLGLNLFPVQGGQIYGLGGESHTDGAYLDELRIGKAARKNWLAMVAGEYEFGSDIGFILGYEFFSRLDVEFDLANDAVRLFEARDCEGVSLAYWKRDAEELPIAGARAPKIELTVEVNGKRMLAMLDSGASTSLLSMAGAAQLGVSSAAPGVLPGSCIYGIGRKRLDSWIVPLQSFTIGNETIKNPKIVLADLWQHTRVEVTGSHLRSPIDHVRPEAILGVDFLRSHRVLVAHSQRKLYFSYVGGTVFQSPQGKPCSDK
jgi:predicted aspartyl protease